MFGRPNMLCEPRQVGRAFRPGRQPWQAARPLQEGRRRLIGERHLLAPHRLAPHIIRGPLRHGRGDLF